jgi:hypothetical protein
MTEAKKKVHIKKTYKFKCSNCGRGTDIEHAVSKTNVECRCKDILLLCSTCKKTNKRNALKIKCSCEDHASVKKGTKRIHIIPPTNPKAVTYIKIKKEE